MKKALSVLVLVGILAGASAGMATEKAETKKAETKKAESVPASAPAKK